MINIEYRDVDQEKIVVGKNVGESREKISDRGSSSSECFVEKISLFTGGGLLSVVEIIRDEAKIITDWPEEMTIESMKFTAEVLDKSRKMKRNLFLGKSWVLYVPEGSQYILLIKVTSRRYFIPTTGLSRRICEKLRSIPEEAYTAGELIVDTLKEVFKCNFKVTVGRYESLHKEIFVPLAELVELT
ncbi:MAG: hypothetical protein NDP24_03180 [Crenarchaeota archaeon]|nr:hypothetical protein [Thermoproteota archaeon]